ncbi:uncharacterized protein LOC128230202 [Mya arenaria]|uniref:uncharacterized protein LOC128230202 n=1 Tax=Mya arenaria TaxID=6604 RepID=UPI0022E7DDAE|nr:uncharacterized protein LOC128230202 [Mya arenaria]
MGNTFSEKKRGFRLGSRRTASSLPTPCSNKIATTGSSSLSTPIPCISELEETPNAPRTSRQASVPRISAPQSSAICISEVDVGVYPSTAAPLHVDAVDGEIRDEDEGYINIPVFSNDEQRSFQEDQSSIEEETPIESLQRGETARSSKTSSSSKTSDSGNSSQPSDDYLTLLDSNVRRKCPVHCLQHKIRRKMKDPSDIKFMVDVYKELIVKTVQVKDVLVSLHHVIDDACYSEIEELQEKKSNKELMESLLKYIEDSSAPGKWQSFIDALNEHEYLFLVQLLLHKTEDDHHEHRALLKVLSPTLLKNISINECLDTLYSKGIIPENERDRIERFDKNFGPIEATREIIKVVPRRSPLWIKEFAGVLKDNFMTNIAELFYIPEEEMEGDCSNDCQAYLPTVDVPSVTIKSELRPCWQPDDTYSSHEIFGNSCGNGYNEIRESLRTIQNHIEIQTEMIKRMDCTVERHSLEIHEMRDSQAKLSPNSRLDTIESEMKDIKSTQTYTKNKVHNMKRYVKDIHQIMLPTSSLPPVCGRMTGSDSGIVFDGSGSGVALRPHYLSDRNLSSTHL